MTELQATTLHQGETTISGARLAELANQSITSVKFAGICGIVFLK